MGEEKRQPGISSLFEEIMSAAILRFRNHRPASKVFSRLFEHRFFDFPQRPGIFYSRKGLQGFLNSFREDQVFPPETGYDGRISVHGAGNDIQCQKGQTGNEPPTVIHVEKPEFVEQSNGIGLEKLVILLERLILLNNGTGDGKNGKDQ